MFIIYFTLIVLFLALYKDIKEGLRAALYDIVMFVAWIISLIARITERWTDDTAR